MIEAVLAGEGRMQNPKRKRKCLRSNWTAKKLVEQKNLRASEVGPCSMRGRAEERDI